MRNVFHHTISNIIRYTLYVGQTIASCYDQAPSIYIYIGEPLGGWHILSFIMFACHVIMWNTERPYDALHIDARDFEKGFETHTHFWMKSLCIYIYCLYIPPLYTIYSYLKTFSNSNDFVICRHCYCAAGTQFTYSFNILYHMHDGNIIMMALH